MVTKANSARHTSRSKAFGDLQPTQLPGGQQLRERVPYTVLLNQSAATSMPAKPSETWTTQGKARGHVQQEAVRSQAGGPLQSTPVMTRTFRRPFKAPGIDNQQAQPQGVSDLTTQQASMQQTHFVDENYSDQHSVPQRQQLQPLSTSVPGGEAVTAVGDQLQPNAHTMHADHMQQSHRLPGTAERPVAFAADTSDSTQGIVPLHTHISLDSFRLSTNDCQLDSYTQVGPASSNDTLNLHGSSLRGTVNGTAQMLQGNTAAALTQQPMQLHTSLVALQQQPQLVHADDEAAWGMSTNGSDTDVMQLPAQRAAAAVAAQDRRDTSSMLAGVGHVPRRSSQRQAKAMPKQAAEKGRAGRQTSRAKSAQPWGSADAGMGRAKSTQPMPAGQGNRAAARALRQSGSFASPTRSSAAKTKTTGRDRTVTAVDSSSAAEVDFMQTQSVPAAPLMSTFRLGDLFMSNPPTEAPAPTTQQQRKQQPQQQLPQQQPQQQKQQAQQQQHAHQQPEQPHASQQGMLQQPSAPLDQQHQQQLQQQPGAVQGSPTVSTSDVAEALGRLCQAATRKKQSAHGSKQASARSSRGSSPRQVPPSTSSKRNQSPRAGITASASNSGSSTPGLASSSKKNQSPHAGITASANNSGSSSPSQAPSSSRSWHAGAAQTTADGHESTASNSGHTMPALQVSVSMPGTAEGSPHAADTTDATCSSMFSSGADSQAPNPQDQSHDAATQRACTADVATDSTHNATSEKGNIAGTRSPALEVPNNVFDDTAHVTTGSTPAKTVATTGSADNDISQVAAEDDADKAVPDQASSGSMQHAAAQSSNAAADQDQSEKAPESFQQSADEGNTGSKPESSSGNALKGTIDRDAGDHGGLTPQPKGVQAAVYRVRDSDVVEMQSPNKSKYAQSQTWQAGVKMVDHPVGGQLLQAFPELASKTGSELLALLASGTDMRKAWEGGSGGSNRLMQCLVHQGAACIAYSHGWMRQTVQHTILRVHVPLDGWQSGQAITVDTSKGAIDLEPPTASDYAVWVLGLNTAMIASQEGIALSSEPTEQTVWNSQLNVMSK